MRATERLGIFLSEGPDSADQAVDRAAQRVEIGPWSLLGLQPEDLLGSGIGKRASVHEIGATELPGEPKVGQHHPDLGLADIEEVGGLEVAVDDPSRMSVGEAIEDLQEQRREHPPVE